MYVCVNNCEFRLGMKSLSQTEELFESILHSSPDCILVCDVAGTIELASNACSDMFMLQNSGEMIGTNVFDYISEEDKIRAKENLLILHTQKIGTIRYKASKSNGDELYLDVNTDCIRNKAGIPLKYILIARDVTEHVKANVELNKLLQAVTQSPSSVMITDIYGRIEYVNPSFIEYTGYTSEEVIGLNPRFLNSGKNNPQIYEEMWDTITDGRVWKGEWINKKKNGQFYWEQQTISPIFDSLGEITNYLAIKQDVTEMKRNEQEINDLNSSLEMKIIDRTEKLRKAEQAAILANQAKSEFLSRMSHELRTPMNSILGYSQLLELSNLDEKQRKSVSNILNGGRHLLDLINEVLDISRIESGRLSYSIEPTDVEPLIKEVYGVIQPLTLPRDIQIQYYVDSSILKVKTDKQRLKQILINLANNAVKYNKVEGGVKIEVIPSPLNDNVEKKARFKVSDTGVGIAEENIERIFTPFDRIGVEQSGIEGSGLGLTVVKKLVEVLGGEIHVMSKLGVGSEFWFDLPLAGEQDGVSRLNQIQVKEEQITEKSGTVLYIEDNPSNVILVENILEMYLPMVMMETFISAAESFEYLGGSKPDLILLDLNLPDMHGSEVLKKLKSNPSTKAIPVIVISADIMYPDINGLIEAGAELFISKPFDVKLLLEKINLYIH